MQYAANGTMTHCPYGSESMAQELLNVLKFATESVATGFVQGADGSDCARCRNRGGVAPPQAQREGVEEWEDLRHPDKPFPRPGQTTDIPMDELVERIKRGQRASAEWKERWWAWCDVNGGTRDPVKLSLWELCMAVSQCGEPPLAPPLPSAHHLPAVSSKKLRPAYPPPQPADSPFHADLVNRIKVGQKISEDWKAKWWAWCDQEMQSTYDPSRHALDQLLLAIKTVGFPPDQPTPEPDLAVELSPDLVEKVKVLQRTSPAFKVAWGEYCEEHGKGRRDPAKHSLPFIKKALDHLGQSHLYLP